MSEMDVLVLETMIPGVMVSKTMVSEAMLQEAMVQETMVQETMVLKTMVPVLLSFGISVVLCPLCIPLLKRLHVKQQVREDGPKKHLKKKGTPTMGGIVILLAVAVTSFYCLSGSPELLPVLFVTLGFGMVGFLDDCIKVVFQRTLGLTIVQKLFLQVLVTAVFVYYYMKWEMPATAVRVPFGGSLELGGFYPLFLFVAFLGTVNGANLTDGLDGLAAGVTLMIAVFLSCVAVGTGSGIAPITCAVAGALLGFLVYNIYPAQVFMGDTGALALGGFVAASAFLLRIPLFIVMVGIVYLVEVVSVILQVAVFRLCGGKRLFRMAPFHHHLELCGWGENKIVAVFLVVTAAFCILAFFGL